MNWFESMRNAMLEGEAEETMRLVRLALDNGIDPDDILKQVVIDGMSSVGRDFKNGKFYIPDVLMASRASHAVMYMLSKCMNFSDAPKQRGVVVVGTVAGDLHDIGKNIVAFLLESEHYKVIDLGIDVLPEVFVSAVAKYHPDILGLSALLTTTVGEMGRVIKSLKEAGLRDQVKVYVSGVPVTQELADKIGADHYCEDARDTLDYAASVCGGED